MKELEILVEVIAEHYHGEDKKWNFIAATEGVKYEAYVCLVLFSFSFIYFGCLLYLRIIQGFS